MWIRAIFLATLVILGNTYGLEDLDSLPSSLDALLAELKEREARDPVPKECGGQPADIAFIIDDSRSIYEPNFYKGMDFLQKFVQTFQIDPDIVRIAAVTFGQRVITESAFGFSAHTTKAEVIQALKDIKFMPKLGGSTNTAMAISYARKEFFSHARPEAKQIAIVLTDGKSDNFRKTKAEAELLRSQGVQIIAIGVGRSASETELRAIASDTKSAFMVNSYDALEHIITTLGYITCKEREARDPVPKEREARDQVLKEREARDQVLKECLGKPADIAFIIDDSWSVWKKDFKIGMNFLKKFVQIFQIAPDIVRIAVVAFAKEVREKSAFGFSKHNTKAEVIQALGDIKMVRKGGGGTYTDRAISYARKEFFSHARPNVKKIAIVLTDGQSRDKIKTKAEAELLRSQGVQIIAIGVGDKPSETELRAIASDEESAFMVESYDALEHIITKLGFITCKVTTTVAPTTIPTTLPPTTTTTTTTTTPPPKAEPCDGQAIDFNFVFDPAQMGKDRTKHVIGFIRIVISAEDLDNGKVRVGTVMGPCPEGKGFSLDHYKTLPEIREHFDEYRKTDIASLVTELRMKSFDPKNGGRTKARKVAVVFLSGKLSDPVKAVQEAKLAKANGIEIVIVNMGSLNHEIVLESMASGKSSHILQASDERGIHEMARKFVAQICKKKSEPACRSTNNNANADAQRMNVH